MTDPIKAKIQELLPDIKWEWQEHDYKDGFDYTAYAPLTLAVVLRAIGKGRGKEAVFVSAKGYFAVLTSQETLDVQYGLRRAWNLEHDNYDQQSEECKQFIGSLLGII